MHNDYPNKHEMEFALKNLQRLDHELDVHERLILRNFRKMAVDDQMQILSHMLERAQHYNGAIIAGGYTAFFAAWAFFQNQYQGAWYDASLLLMLLSVAVFVMWNVFGNIIMGNDLFRKAETMARNMHDPVYLYQALAALDKELLERTMRRKRWWWMMLWLSIVPGIVGALIYFWTVGAGIVGRLHSAG